MRRPNICCCCCCRPIWPKPALGGGEGANTAAIGARVDVTAGEVTQARQVQGGGGQWGHQDDLVVHFGVGGQATADVTITWLDVGAELAFEEGTSEFSVPLSTSLETGSYLVDIGTSDYLMLMEYELFEELDVDHRFIPRARGIMITTHDFDSISYDCDDCLDGETTITCYF